MQFYVIHKQLTNYKIIFLIFYKINLNKNSIDR